MSCRASALVLGLKTGLMATTHTTARTTTLTVFRTALTPATSIQSPLVSIPRRANAHTGGVDPSPPNQGLDTRATASREELPRHLPTTLPTTLIALPLATLWMATLFNQASALA